MSKHFFCWGLFLLSLLPGLFSQSYNIGVPIVQSFPKETSNISSQNWDMAQDSFGVMYFANNEGMVVFDGTRWKVFPLPNYTIVRSLELTTNRIIYAGGQNEFGRFSQNEEGYWEFESLKYLIPKEHQNFEDVWKIELIEGGVLFIASNKLFYLKNEKIEVFLQGTIFNLLKTGGKVYTHDFLSGIYYFENNQLIKLEKSEFFVQKRVETILEHPKGLLIGTFKEGFYLLNENGIKRWETDVDQFLIENNIHEVTPIAGNRIAIGTGFGGLIILNQSGRSIYHLHKGNGLMGNSFLSIFYDKSQNLWCGLTNGLNYLHTNSPFTRILPDKDQDGIGYGAKIYKDKIYLATNKGIYFNDWKNHYSPFESNNFKLIPNTKGQVWGLDLVYDQLLAGHNNGAFLINDGQARQFYDSIGIWTFDSLRNYSNTLIAGSYTDISIFKRQGDKIESQAPLANLNESCRFVEQDNYGNIWMAHPYRGIFKITPSPTLEDTKIQLMGKKEGLPSNILNHLFKIKDDVIFCGEKGVFTYNYDTQTFEPYEAFNELFGKDTKVKRLQETPTGSIWFITNNEIGLLKISDKGLEKQVEKIILPFSSQQLNQGHESIYPYKDDNVFITNDKGFIHYHPFDFLKVDSSFYSILNEIKITSNEDSLVSNGYFFQNDHLVLQQPSAQIQQFPHYLNDWFFKFTSTDYASGSSTLYRYFLEGYEKDWLDWNHEKIKEYTNLSPGKYTFHLQAQNNYQIKSKPISFSFQILPPWYLSKWAYAFYSVLFILATGSIVRTYRKKYFGLKEDHEEVVKKSNETIGKLKAEKIESELAYKQRELVSTTLNLVKKNETLATIKGQLSEIRKDVKDREPARRIEQLLKKLDIEELQDENWEQMMFHFNQLHKGFFDRLKSDFPSLTPKDLKMCVYLRMNLSSKEMTSLLNVTTRGIEASRYRLRKKFNLHKEQNLTEFLMTY